MTPEVSMEMDWTCNGCVHGLSAGWLQLQPGVSMLTRLDDVRRLGVQGWWWDDGGTMVGQVVGQWWGRWWDRWLDSVGTMMGQVVGRWWDNGGAGGGTMMEQVVVQVVGRWWCRWSTNTTDQGCLCSNDRTVVNHFLCSLDVTSSCLLLFGCVKR